MAPLGVAFGTVSAWEAGGVDHAQRPPGLLALAQLYEVGVEELCGGGVMTRHRMSEADWQAIARVMSRHPPAAGRGREGQRPRRRQCPQGAAARAGGGQRPRPPRGRGCGRR